jgi:hypothetical protein
MATDRTYVRWMDRYYELEDWRRSIVMLPPGSAALDREEAVRLIAELQDALRALRQPTDDSS